MDFGFLFGMGKMCGVEYRRKNEEGVLGGSLDQKEGSGGQKLGLDMSVGPKIMNIKVIHKLIRNLWPVFLELVRVL